MQRKGKLPEADKILNIFFFLFLYPEVKEQSAEEDAQTEVESTKQLTPVLQHSVSEESASSTASVGVEAKTRWVRQWGGGGGGSCWVRARAGALGAECSGHRAGTRCCFEVPGTGALIGVRGDQGEKRVPWALSSRCSGKPLSYSVLAG